jgi:hypothetical protein
MYSDLSSDSVSGTNCNQGLLTVETTTLNQK